MDGIFARHDFLWNVHHALALDTVGTRNQSVVSPDGANGKAGKDGKPGDMTNPPGGGTDGAPGHGSKAVFVNGADLTFEHDPVNPSWSVSATSGKSGHGGAGGDIGSFPPDSTYPIPNAGNGGDGSLSGDATAVIMDRIIFAHTGTTSDFGVTIAISAVTGHAGTGGAGGVGNGASNDGGFGGSGGNGGNGADAGVADAELDSAIFKTVSDPADPNDVRVTLSLSALAGDGGDGGDGGHGTQVIVIGSFDGTPGHGGNGGGAKIVIDDDTMTLGGKAGGTAIATIAATARAGDGGDGGDVPGGAFGGGHGTPGDGGSASVELAALGIHGGAADDTIRLALNAVAGHGGTNGAGVLGADGTATVSVHDCAFDGGKGVNTLAFSWTGNATGAAVNVNLLSGFFQVAGGPSNSLTNFENVTGGRGFDAITGDTHANTLDGNLGDDLLLGGVGADRMIGGAGDDQMTGGAGIDTFVYGSVAESTSTVFDQITDLNFAQDKIDVKFNVTGTSMTVVAEIHAGTFDSDMEGATAGLAKHHAMLLVDSGGDFDSHTFLVVDANGVTGYQAGHDLLIDVTGATNVNHFAAGLFI